MDSAFSELWLKFWKWVAEHPTAAYLFRGQADASPIMPKIGRATYNYSPAREEQLFHAFIRAARPFLRGTQMSTWESLALAQHHGAPTRLVDWSTSPLVAAWFAVTSYPETTDAAIFALSLFGGGVETIDITTGLTGSRGRYDHPFDIKSGWYLIETAPVSARITTQRGIFSVHGQPQLPLTLPLADRFDVPSGLRGEFQNKLLDLGIDASHIFPDLDGLCRMLDWKMKTGRGFTAIV